MELIGREYSHEDYQHTKKRQVAQAVILPAPTEGWVSINHPLAEDLRSAQILKNIIPRRTVGETRRGCAKIADTGDGTAIKTLMTYKSGSETKLLGAGGGNIYEIEGTPTAPGTPTSIRSGFTEDDFQFINMANGANEMRMVLVNGADGIYTYSPSEGVDLVFPTDNVDTLSDVINFKSRLFFIEKDSTSLYYGDPLSNQPATLKEFPVGPILRKGGSLVAIDSVSLDGGSGPDDMLAIVTSEGEAVIFAGIDPATDFHLVGVFSLSKPVGPKCLQKLGPDLLYFSSQGPQSMSQLYYGRGRADLVQNPIQDHFEDAYKTGAHLHGWSMTHYSKDSWIVFNIPVADYANRQFILNQENNKWWECAGWDANSFAEHDDELYFSDDEGSVYQANYGLSDNGEPIEVDWVQNWSSYGTPYLKKFNMCRINLRADFAPKPFITMLTDYALLEARYQPGFTDGTPGTLWDTGLWNVSRWYIGAKYYSEVFGLSDQGHTGAFRFTEKLIGADLQILGGVVTFEIGAAI